jgi:hypothetical protein
MLGTGGGMPVKHDAASRIRHVIDYRHRILLAPQRRPVAADGRCECPWRCDSGSRLSSAASNLEEGHLRRNTLSTASGLTGHQSGYPARSPQRGTTSPATTGGGNVCTDANYNSPEVGISVRSLRPKADGARSPRMLSRVSRGMVTPPIAIQPRRATQSGLRFQEWGYPQIRTETDGLGPCRHRIPAQTTSTISRSPDAHTP